MDFNRNLMNTAKELIKYFESLGITVNTNTKARGHHGFCMKNRIDVSKNVKEELQIQTLLHEFAHFVHSKYEANIERTGGTLAVLFDDNSAKIFEELLAVTNWVDELSLHKRLSYHKEQIHGKIVKLDEEIKKVFPNFQRSKKFKEFDKIIKKSKAKYLLKYDRVKVCGWFFEKDKVYSIDNIENDFPDLKPEFVAYIRLKSYQKKQKRVSAKINKLNKYFERPTELFARFIEGLYKDYDYTKSLAPICCEKFFEKIDSGYYPELKTALDLANVNDCKSYDNCNQLKLSQGLY